jgi:hypothetical protein
VLKEEGEIRSERGQQRTDKPHAYGEGDVAHRGTVFGALIARTSATADCPGRLMQSRYAVSR